MRKIFFPTIIFLLVAAAGIWLVPGSSDYPLDRLDALGLIALGLVVGVYGTIVGVGGGFLIVPILLLVWQFPPEQAAGTSLVVVFLNATVGSFAYARHKRIDFRSGLWFAGATLPGAVAGAFLAEYFSGRVFALTFGTLLLLVAALLIWKPVRSAPPRASTDADGEGSRRSLTDSAGNTFAWSFSLPLGMTISFAVGFLSSALGIGGGIFHVPAMMYLLSFPAVIATATSQFILAFSSLVGGATHVSLGNVLFGPATLMGIGVITGAQAGGALARRARGAVVVRLLAVALILVGARLLMRGL